ncbi:MAG: 4-hydroxythreonine-4-phosphate dehydrogenase PdxA [Rhodothermales bacterium]|nr:4-hydroxythreonine-4-phosphate dehydrogenase PdxA [Rhodothermales bacterium]
MDDRPRPRIVISMGDPNGIGPEVVVKTLADGRLRKYVDPVVTGSVKIIEQHIERIGLKELSVSAYPDCSGGVAVLDVVPGEQPAVEFGKITATAGRLAMMSVEKAVRLCLDGTADAMVTAPLSKEAIHLAGFNLPGHTEFIANLTGSSSFTMMMVSDSIRVGLVTGHVPIWDVPKLVTKEAILDKIRVIGASLVNDFGVARPKIAVLGLNPHAGEGGVIGREENDTIKPAVAEACEEGYSVLGPYPADGFFASRSFRSVDAVLAMYHDQGLIPFKTLTFNTGVNFTAGLPIVRTSPDHGTAFDIAGTGKATPDSFRTALYVALDVARRRVRSSEPQAS